MLNPAQHLNVDDTLPGVYASDEIDGLNNGDENGILINPSQVGGGGTPRTQIFDSRSQNTPQTTQNTQQTPSSLFRPKSKLYSNENEGCDLSYGNYNNYDDKKSIILVKNN